jgi:Ni2+-binding GTPase involved in maturation of urease and hydrogenase
MISIVYGPKGSGKTKALIEKANGALDEAKGSLIYVTNSQDHIYELKHQIRYIVTNDYGIADMQSFIGFIKGLIANDHDIEYIFIDGPYTIAKVNVDEMQPLFELLDKYEDIKFTLTVSSDYENLPEYIKKYVK